MHRLHSTSDTIRTDLRLTAELFDENQRRRIALGERLRAIHQGRSAVPMTDGGAPMLLEQAYARATLEEQDMAEHLRLLVMAHPAWPWLANERGIGPLLAGRLLARLDISRAPTPSSFWAYCGLSTVPGREYVCASCGLQLSYPFGYAVRPEHTVRGTKRACPGALVPGDTARTVRTAPRRPARGMTPAFDARARRLCYLIGVSFLRTRGPYKDYYDAERVRIDSAHPAWPRARAHMGALRKTEKLFLRGLWVAWRDALDLNAADTNAPPTRLIA